MDIVHGVDVSVYEPNIDWRVLRAQGFKYALVRATSSTNYVDAKFYEHWAGAREAGLLRGAYHYLFGGQSARKQADIFISTLGADKGELPPIVDLEDKYNEDVSNRKIIDTCKKFLDIIEEEFGRTPMVYSRRTYLEPRVSRRGRAPSWADDYELWIAQYPFVFDADVMPNDRMPRQPQGWKDWKFWQYSENAIVEGVTDDLKRPTRIDLNWFRGTEEELYKFANVEPVEPKKYRIKSGDTFRGIAESQGISLAELLEANQSLLKVGTTLNIPGRISIPDEVDAPLPLPEDDVEEDTTPAEVTHRVKAGDSLFAIALKYRTSVDAIMEINPQIVNRSIIFEGQVIKIPK